jgi:hypothetical protein
MNQRERIEMLDRFTATNRWLARVYDPNRSETHRVAIWNFLMQTAEPRLRKLLIAHRLLDAECVKFWNHYKN